MQKGGFFSLGTCPEAIIFTLMLAEPFAAIACSTKHTATLHDFFTALG